MRENAHVEDSARDVGTRVETALATLSPYNSLLLAVSGGPDSVALLLAIAHWRARGGREIAVATVDHGLRADSRAEAEQVGRWAKALGFAAHLLSWEGAKPKTRLQEKARDARYALLADCARRIGADAIVTAHHADDQVETILFRLTRGSGVAGLAGMARVSRCGEAALLRPLLDLRKSDLEKICTGANHPFFSDPSNANEIFARARLRNLAPTLSAQGLDHDALLRLGARAAQADAALAQCAHELFARALMDAKSGVSLDAATLRAAPQEIIQRTLALAIAKARPSPDTTSILRLERLERASHRLAAALAAQAPLRLTLGDILIDAQDGRVSLKPAPPRGAAR